MWTRIAIVISLMSTICAQNVPVFSSYPATPFRGVPAKPRFPASDFWALGHFRESVEFDAGRGPNFAGHFTIARWSCGTGCTGMVVLDAPTGTWYPDMPFGMLVLLPGLDSNGYSFRLDSRLLIVEGYFDIDVPDATSKCSRRYYEWMGTNFRLLRQDRLTCNSRR